MHRNNTIRICLIRLAIVIVMSLWMSVIFGFSAEEGAESQSLSDKITIHVVQIINQDYESLSLKEQEEFFNRVSFCVRKTGHFGEYAILGLLFAALLMTFERIRINKRNMAVLAGAGLWCMLYAVTDEIHQGFVDGRSPKIMDVGIDMLGGTAGAVFLILLWKFYKYIIIRRQKVTA